VNHVVDVKEFRDIEDYYKINGYSAIRIEPRPRSTFTVLENQNERRWTLSNVQGKNPTQSSTQYQKHLKNGKVVNLLKYTK